LWALAGLTTVAYGALYYAQPLLALATEHERGWTRAQTNFAFTLALLVTAFIAPAVGRALDARGSRGLLSLGVLLGALAFTLLAATSSYPLFVLGWLLAGASMALTFYEAAFTALGQQVQGQQACSGDVAQFARELVRSAHVDDADLVTPRPQLVGGDVGDVGYGFISAFGLEHGHS